MPLSCSKLMCQVDNCLLCKIRAETLMQKHCKHMWKCLQLAQVAAQKPLPSKADSVDVFWQKMLCLQLAELRKKLEELHSAASVDHLAKVDLESRQHRLHGDSSRLEKRLAAVEADRESLSHQLKASCILIYLSVCLYFCQYVGLKESPAISKP